VKAYYEEAHTGFKARIQALETLVSSQKELIEQTK
jgi:hypothetical protein